uniref:Uncharacterized protein n=1 Tax=Triticum urartu TaxID=4572 RepID=A0A8R7TE41_TRIUA
MLLQIWYYPHLSLSQFVCVGGGGAKQSISNCRLRTHRPNGRRISFIPLQHCQPPSLYCLGFSCGFGWNCIV